MIQDHLNDYLYGLISAYSVILSTSVRRHITLPRLTHINTLKHQNLFFDSLASEASYATPSYGLIIHTYVRIRSWSPLGISCPRRIRNTSLLQGIAFGVSGGGRTWPNRHPAHRRRGRKPWLTASVQTNYNSNIL
jgi:hypothetical protein